MLPKLLKILFASVLLCSLQSLYAQSVGLVLSGGGAKGCTHVGVIKALEEHNIPIDYVTGTSIGSIIGALYSMGYTPEEMESLISSEMFNTWLKGRVDEKEKFYFKEDDVTPEFVSFKMKLKESFTFKPEIPNSFISPDQMNQATMYLFAQANTICKENFDSLFIPFRCISTNMTEKGEYIHRNGDLGDAVRASMSFPFVFQPVRVNGQLMVDGGIYNNFPLDVMQEEFKPDYIIGCNVSDGPANTQDESPISLLENLIIQNTVNDLNKEDGIVLRFKYEDVGLLDFEQAKKLIQIGYDSTIAHIDEIKKSIGRTVSKEDLASKRFAFNQKKPPLIFQNIIIKDLKKKQQSFISKTFHKKTDYFSYNSFKKNYFKLLSDKKIEEIVPHADYNPQTNAYDLILDVSLDDHFRFGIGGNISSTTANLLYASAKFLTVQRLSYDFSLDGQIGMLYRNAHFQARIDFPYQIPFCVKAIADISHNSYSNTQNAFYEFDIPTSAYNTEFHTKMKISIPFLLKGEITGGIGYGIIKNKYHGLYSAAEDLFDQTEYRLGTALVQYRHNSLSHKQYPVSGTLAKINVQYIFGKKEMETRVPLDSVTIDVEKKGKKINWWQFSAKIDHYIPMGKHFSLGLTAEGVYSTHPLENNYMETLLMCPKFVPTKHSLTVFNTAFSSNSYLAAGIKPIVSINKFLQLRFEGFFFAPHKAIIPTATFKPEYEKDFSKLYAMAEATFAVQLRYITAGLYANWYSYPEKNYNFGLNIGYLIFHDKLIE